MNKQDPIQSAYNTWANSYDQVTNPTRDLSAAVLRHYESYIRDTRVMEIGCGTGINTVWLAEHARDVLACDLSENMMERARLKIGKADLKSAITFKQLDITRNWDISKGFDVLIDNLVLEHIDSLHHIFNQAYRVLQTRGVFIITELHPYKQLAGSQARFEDEQTGNEIKIPAYPHMISDYIDAAQQAGFELHIFREWMDPDQPGELPRLATFIFRK